MSHAFGHGLPGNRSKLMALENEAGRRASADAEETAKGASRGDGA